MNAIKIIGLIIFTIVMGILMWNYGWLLTMILLVVGNFIFKVFYSLFTGH